MKPNSLIQNIPGILIRPDKKIDTESNLFVAGTENILAIGDSAGINDPRTQKSVPGFAYTAIMQGRIAAKNIIKKIRRHKIINYHPYYNFWICPLGGKFAVAHLGNVINITGFLGWIVREKIFILYFMSIMSPIRAIKLYLTNITIFSRNDGW